MVVPAQAGVILDGIRDRFEALSGPRTGGGDPKFVVADFSAIEWSPHRRG